MLRAREGTLWPESSESEDEAEVSHKEEKSEGCGRSELHDELCSHIYGNGEVEEGGIHIRPNTSVAICMPQLGQFDEYKSTYIHTR